MNIARPPPALLHFVRMIIFASTWRPLVLEFCILHMTICIITLLYSRSTPRQNNAFFLVVGGRFRGKKDQKIFLFSTKIPSRMERSLSMSSKRESSFHARANPTRTSLLLSNFSLTLSSEPLTLTVSGCNGSKSKISSRELPKSSTV